MPLRRKRPTETNMPPRRKGGGAQRQEAAESLSLRADIADEDARSSEYERELDRLDAATSTRH